MLTANKPHDIIFQIFVAKYLRKATTEWRILYIINFVN